MTCFLQDGDPGNWFYSSEKRRVNRIDGVISGGGHEKSDVLAQHEAEI
jgi:hypothetical protein